MKNRYLIPCILDDLFDKKMVFIGGPRQVGKTTLGNNLIANFFKKTNYYNWDNRNDRKIILSSSWESDTELIIFDEIHKYKKWKSFMKGEFDKHKNEFNFLITGSARLDIYKKGGDSLQGRYHHYRLHPFSVAELLNLKSNLIPFEELEISSNSPQEILNDLEHYGGFPEPFTKHNERTIRRWHNEKIDRMFKEDIQDIEMIRDLASMKILSDILPSKVGSLLSTNSMREDLDVSFRAVSHWLNILESFYYHFRIYPYTSIGIKGLKKEPKLYLWDWSEIKDESKRFENLIASHLYKMVHYLYDYEGYKTNLHFLRDLNKNEVDFLITVDNKPWFAVEIKSNDTIPSKNFTLFKDKYKIPFCYQVIRKSGIDILSNKNIRIISADKFLASLI